MSVMSLKKTSPPSKKWQMKVYRDPLLQIITILLGGLLLDRGDNPKYTKIHGSYGIMIHFSSSLSTCLQALDQGRVKRSDRKPRRRSCDRLGFPKVAEIMEIQVVMIRWIHGSEIRKTHQLIWEISHYLQGSYTKTSPGGKPDFWTMKSQIT